MLYAELKYLIPWNRIFISKFFQTTNFSLWQFPPSQKEDFIKNANILSSDPTEMNIGTSFSTNRLYDSVHIVCQFKINTRLLFWYSMYNNDCEAMRRHLIFELLLLLYKCQSQTPMVSCHVNAASMIFINVLTEPKMNLRHARTTHSFTGMHY